VINKTRFCLAWLLALAVMLAACAAPATAQPPGPPTSEVAQTVEVAGAGTEAPTLPPEPTAAPPTETPAAGFPVTVVDSLGREVTMDAPPERIVTLAPSNTEILFALGAGDRLVGRDDYSDYPAEALDVPSIGSLYPQVNAEAIVALEPDLVMAAGLTNADDVKALADLGLTVFATRVDTQLDDVYNDILDVGTLTGQKAEATTLVDSLQAREAAVTAKTSGLTDLPRVLYEIDGSDPARPWTAGPGSFIDQMLTLAGGDNVGRVGSDAYFQISLEELVAQDPQVIILGSATYGGQTPETVAARVGWDSITAVKDGNVHEFDDNLVSRPGPRVIDGLEALAKLIHPELFQ
jgi:cobalamin transport system substrate-binding protein